MKRLLFALGMLACVAVSESQAGYLIVRVILEGSAAGAGGGIDGMGGGFYPGGEEAGGGYGAGPMPGSYGAPVPPGGGPTPGPGTAGPVVHDPTQSILVVVPFTKATTERLGLPFYPKKDYNPYINPRWRFPLFHKFGHTNVLFDNTLIQVYTDYGSDPGFLRTRQSDLEIKHSVWAKEKGDAQELMDILTQALELGMVKETLNYADELLILAREKKAATTPQVDRFLAVYEKIQKPLRASATKPSDAQYWKETLVTNYPPFPNDQVRGHYCLIYWDASPEERERRLTKLEENFQAFFLVNAVHGIALPVPDKPLTAVLPRTAREVIDLSKSLDALPIVADAFYAPEHELLVLSPERLDANGRTFSQQMRQLYQGGANRSDLLSGRNGPRVSNNPAIKDAKRPEEVARMMTMIMVECFVEDESEWAGISREGTRQLLYATGALPKHVSLPLWLSNGSCEFFTRPKGPVFSTKGKDEKNFATLALHTGYDVPNYVRRKQYADLVEKKQLNGDPGLLLRNVISDVYFDAVHRGIDADDPKLPPPLKKKAPQPAAAGGMGITGGAYGSGPMPGAQYGPGPMPGAVGPGYGSGAVAQAPVETPQAYARRKREFLINKAYATSWALYYYLSKFHQAGLSRYIAELDRMPRDLPLDESTRLAIFSRAFNLTPEAIPQQGQQTYGQFANQWLKMMDTIPPSAIEIELTDPKPPMPAGQGGEGELPPGAAPPGFPGSTGS